MEEGKEGDKKGRGRGIARRDRREGYGGEDEWEMDMEREGGTEPKEKTVWQIHMEGDGGGEGIKIGRA